MSPPFNVEDLSRPGDTVASIDRSGNIYTEGSLLVDGSVRIGGNLFVAGTQVTPGGGSSVAITRGILTTGDVNAPDTAGVWAAMTGISFLVPAVAGDNIEFWAGFMAIFNPANFFEFAVRAGGSLVRYSSTRTATPSVEGDPTLYQTPGTYRGMGSGSFDFEVEAGDLTGANVEIVLATKGTGGVGTTIYKSTNFPMRWWAKVYS